MRLFQDFHSASRARVIAHLVASGVAYADAAIITDYAKDRGPHVIPGCPDRAVWWFGDHWRITAAPR